MTVNLRKGYGSKGYWTGPEVEHTQFYGLKTLFLVPDNIELLDQLIKKVDEDAYQHVYIGMHESYAERKEWFETILLRALQHGRCCTVEMWPQYATLPVFNRIRFNYSTQFCMLIRVEVPNLMVGGFALKAMPTISFGTDQNEAGVMTASYQCLRHRVTHWSKYEQDVDGK
jgi:hypothetical protein